MDEKAWHRLTERAAFARTYLAVQAIYFTCLGIILDNAAFGIAAVFSVLLTILYDRKTIIVLGLIAVGYAALGRAAGVILNGEATTQERVLFAGWVIPWLGTVVSTTQIIGVEALRKVKTTWDG